MSDDEPKAIDRAKSDADLFNEASREKRQRLAGEFMGFLGENKKWWLLPIILAVLVLGALVILAGTGAGPFVYTLG